MTAYALHVLAASERKKRAGLTPTQAARPVQRYQKKKSVDEKGLSKQVSRACDRFFRRRGLSRVAVPLANWKRQSANRQ